MIRTLTRLGLLGCFAIASLATILPAAAQTGSDIRFVNPEALGPSRGYTYLVDANRPGRILYLAGQLGTDPSGKVVSADFREQATQAYENIRIAHVWRRVWRQAQDTGRIGGRHAGRS